MNRRAVMTLLAAPVLALAAGAGWFRWQSGRNPYYSGPVSDHFDGLKFFNPDRNVDKSASELARFLFATPREDWPETWPSPFPQDKPPVEVRDGVRVTLIGHASYLIQTGGVNILCDPVFSKRASPFSFAGPKRVNPPGIAFDDLPKIHAVLVSHNHYDHMDTATLARLVKRDNPRIVAPLGNDTILKAAIPNISVEARDWGDCVEFAPGVVVTLVATAHWSARGLGDRRRALWASFVIETPKGRIYHVGDTGYAEDANFTAHGKAYGPFCLALLPIGAYEPRWFMQTNHMNPEEAVMAFQRLGVEQAVGHHWGTFRLTAEAVDAPEKALADARAKYGLAETQFQAFRPGQVLEI